MTLSEEELSHLLTLSRLEIPSDQHPRFLGQLDKILEALSELDELDLSQVEPSSYAIDQAQTMRDDKVEPFEDLKLAKNAPDFKDNSFAVPKILSPGSDA